MAGPGASRDLTLNLHEKRSGNAIIQTARDLDRLAKGADATSDSMVDMSRDASRLNVEIEETSARIKQLARDFETTGDQSIFGDLSKERAHLRKLEGVLKELADEAVDAGRSFSTGLVKGIDAPRLGPAVIGGLVAGLVAAAPAVGAMIGGALVGAAAVGGIAGGIAQASKDARVRAAARNFGDDISAEFFSGGKAFVAPVIASLNELKSAFRDMDLGASFERLSPHVLTLAGGLADMGRNIMPGLNRAFERAGPFVDALAEGLAETGSALGQFFDRISRSQGSVDGLEALFGLLNGTIRILGASLEWFGDRWRDMLELSAAATKALADVSFGKQREQLLAWNSAFVAILDNTRKVPPEVNLAGAAVETFGEAAGLAARATGSLATALGAAHAQFLSFEGAQIAAKDAIADLSEALDESNGKMGLNSEKGRAARAAMIRVAEASALAAAKKFEETKSVQEADRVYAAHRADLIKTLTAAGKTRKEAERLADAWLGVPPSVRTVVTTHYRTTGNPHEYRPPSVLEAKGRAAGGPVEAGVPYQINERGRETVTFPANGTVHPANLTPAAGGGGRGPVTVRLVADPNMHRGITRAIMEMLRVEILATTGGNVQRALGV